MDAASFLAGLILGLCPGAVIGVLLFLYLREYINKCK
jgi:hypothetical protein